MKGLGWSVCEEFAGVAKILDLIYRSCIEEFICYGVMHNSEVMCHAVFFF